MLYLLIPYLLVSRRVRYWGPLLFLIYINDFSLTLSKIASSILFADDTSIIISNSNLDEFKSNINLAMNETVAWFQSNFLMLNCYKTHFLQFLTKKQNATKIQIVISNSVITNTSSTKLLGMTIDNTLFWKEHIFYLTSRLNKACYAIRVIKPFMTLNILKTVYFSYFHSVMSSGVIFWGNSHLSNNIFKIQKRKITIITNSGKYDSCRQLFKQSQILTLPSQYMFSLLVFVAKNRHLLLSNSDIYDKNTKTRIITATSTCLLQTTLVQKGVLYSGSRIYNHLLTCIKTLSNDLKHFKSKLKSLIEHTFYSLEEFYRLTLK
jgi:hypothetical protein